MFQISSGLLSTPPPDQLTLTVVSVLWDNSFLVMSSATFALPLKGPRLRDTEALYMALCISFCGGLSPGGRGVYLRSLDGLNLRTVEGFNADEGVKLATFKKSWIRSLIS